MTPARTLGSRLRARVLAPVATWCVSAFSGGPIGGRVKLVALRAAGARVEWPLHIDRLVWVRDPAGLEAGPGLVLSRGAVLTCAGGVHFGAQCLVGYHAFIGSANHHVPDSLEQRIAASGHDYAPVHFGDDCWIGAHAVVLPGVTLGDGVVAGAGAVVTQPMEAGSVCVGVPARVVRVRPRVKG